MCTLQGNLQISRHTETLPCPWNYSADLLASTWCIVCWWFIIPVVFCAETNMLHLSGRGWSGQKTDRDLKTGGPQPEISTGIVPSNYFIRGKICTFGWRHGRLDNTWINIKVFYAPFSVGNTYTLSSDYRVLQGNNWDTNANTSGEQQKATMNGLNREVELPGQGLGRSQW